MRPGDSKRCRRRQAAAGGPVGAAGVAEWGEHEIFGIHLAVDEALTNAIHHGNALDEAKHIRFCRCISPKKVRVEIIDEGHGFDPGSLPDPTDADHLTRPCGRGVMLMRAFMSHVEFRDGGSHVVLEKERSL